MALEITKEIELKALVDNTPNHLRHTKGKVIPIRLSSAANLFYQPNDYLKIMPNHIQAHDAIAEATKNFFDDEDIEIALLGAKQDHFSGGPIHICSACNIPILQYGRVMPCQHIFCISCAGKCKDRTHNVCFFCKENAKALEIHRDTDKMFVCAFGQCGRGYVNEFALAEHQRIRKHMPTSQHEKPSISSHTAKNKFYSFSHSPQTTSQHLSPTRQPKYPSDRKRDINGELRLDSGKARWQESSHKSHLYL